MVHFIRTSEFFFNFQTGEVRQRIHQSADDSLTYAAWMTDGRKFVVGGVRGQFYYCVSKSVSETSAHYYC